MSKSNADILREQAKQIEGFFPMAARKIRDVADSLEHK